ncbi:MAG: hypothetical protein WA051_02330 [Minisyncoccia bacterium]
MINAKLKNRLATAGLLVVLFLAFIIPVASVLAQQGNNTTGGTTGNNTTGGTTGNTGGDTQSTALNFKIENPFKLGNSLNGVIDAVLNNAVIPLGGIVVIIMIIYSGFLFVTARGDESQLSTAKKTLLYAAIGAAILLGAVAIEKAIEGTINALR